jgi:hypothetical protein
MTVVHFTNAAGGRTFRSPVAVKQRVRIEKFRPAVGRRMKARAVYDEVGKRELDLLLPKPSGSGLSRQQWSRYKWYFTGGKRKHWQTHATHPEFKSVINAMVKFYDEPPTREVIVSNFYQFDTDNQFDKDTIADELTVMMKKQGLGRAFVKYAPAGVRFHFYAKGFSSMNGEDWIPRDFFSARSYLQGSPVMIDLREGIMRLVETLFQHVKSNAKVRITWIGVITYGTGTTTAAKPAVKGGHHAGKKAVRCRQTRPPAA